MARKTVKDWEAKGWTAVSLQSGVPVPVAYDPTTQDLVVKGQLYDADGNQVTGHGRPKVHVESTDTGGNIVQPDPTVIENVTVLYKVVDEEEDEED
jgi:hypothetical protein